MSGLYFLHKTVRNMTQILMYLNEPNSGSFGGGVYDRKLDEMRADERRTEVLGGPYDVNRGGWNL